MQKCFVIRVVTMILNSCNFSGGRLKRLITDFSTRFCLAVRKTHPQPFRSLIQTDFSAIHTASASILPGYRKLESINPGSMLTLSRIITPCAAPARGGIPVKLRNPGKSFGKQPPQGQRKAKGRWHSDRLVERSPGAVGGHERMSLCFVKLSH